MDPYPLTRCAYFPLLSYSLDLFHEHPDYQAKLLSMFSVLLTSLSHAPVLNELISNYI